MKKKREKTSEEEVVEDSSQTLFNSDPEDQEVDVTDLESPDDENEKNKPLEETFIVKQNVEKAAEKASTERSASQTWFKCGKTGPKCHKRFIHSDLEKHNQQYHSFILVLSNFSL